MNPPILNLCFDLNVWCAAFLADRKGMSGTASQTLIEVARRGHSGHFPVQLVVSWGMLTRLRKVFEVDWGISRQTVDPVIETIAGYARLGPLATAPHLTRGGTGLMPMRDEEDAHVVETALAGGSHLLATANFDDFIGSKSRVLEEGKIAVVGTAAARLVVAHPYRAAAWMREGLFPDAETVERQFVRILSR
ncbi:PIN domain-containing protein [Phaeospirillum tilakii]|uniref:PIN domain-containing protein n=1 Tax=Phaeospirillum tilakii TaxID=741673 RepID=A0ABW5CFK8_9PROT